MYNENMEPLVFEPYLRPQVWGERRLAGFGKQLPVEGTFGESWEISAHPLHVSRVAEGQWRGALLTDLCASRSEEVFGFPLATPAPFPLLIKLLDCHDLLSIQVHPTNEVAARLRPGESGKTEAWLVLEAGPRARIYAGLLPGTTPADLQRHLNDGTVADCLHAFVPRAGDCLFLPAGTVHAVGGGVVMAEVQQTSDATFRLFDWNRLGPDGQPRPLHISEALEAIDWSRGPVNPMPPTLITGLPPGINGEHLVTCPYFTMERYRLAGHWEIPVRGRLSIWIVLAGSAELADTGGKYQRRFQRGETVLVPASAPPLFWKTGDATVLGVRLPQSA
jgi:mannose-6-phosphate isomerase